MNLFVILSNSICLTIIAIIFCSLFLQKSFNKRRKVAFSLICCTISLALINSIASESLAGNVELTPLIYSIELITFLIIDILILTFIYYLKTLNYGNKNVKGNVLLLLAVISSIIRIIITTALSHLGYIFTIENGRYEESTLLWVAYALPIISLVLLISYILVNKNLFSKRQIIITLIYSLAPLPGVILEFFFQQYFFLNLVITLAILMMFILIQDNEFEENKIKQKLLEELTVKDFLTNLNNRRSYYNRIQTLENDELIGIVFCDLNGLKKANDTYGHSYGDKLLTRFADMLIETFGQEDSFRISGDEFVVIKNITNSDEFYEKVEKFKTYIEENDYIAATGYTYGKGKAFDALVAQAETKMYEHKIHKAVNRK